MEQGDQLNDGQTDPYSDEEFEVNSLFDSASPLLDHFPALLDDPTMPSSPPCQCSDTPMAQRTAPSIPGLFFDPSLLIPEDLAADLAEHAQRHFSIRSCQGQVNQVMLFGRATEKGSGLPRFLDELIPALSSLLEPHLSKHAHTLLFPPTTSPSACASRQAILNHYTPGEGITSHVDLLTRFADGIVGVSLGSGTVMTFRRVMENGCVEEPRKADRCDVYLPERSVLVLTEDARYKWTHGIEGRLGDHVVDEESASWIERRNRVSITLRWLLPGADIVGGNNE